MKKIIKSKKISNADKKKQLRAQIADKVKMMKAMNEEIVKV